MELTEERIREIVREELARHEAEQAKLWEETLSPGFMPRRNIAAP